MKLKRKMSNRNLAAGDKPANKVQRSHELHPRQEELAALVRDKPGIIVAPMGAGKPRVGGKWLDRIVPERLAELDKRRERARAKREARRERARAKREEGRDEEDEDSSEDEDETDVPKGVLVVVVVTNAKHGRDQAEDYGTDFPGPYHSTDLKRLKDVLNGDRRSARIMIPQATLRKWCYDDTHTFRSLIDELGQPEVIVLWDESTEAYKSSNGRLPSAVDALRTKYKKATNATITVFGMSGTPMLDDKSYAARAKKFFGEEPKLYRLPEDKEYELLDAINPQRQVSTRKTVVVPLPAPTEPADMLAQLSTLLVGNELFKELRGFPVVQRLSSELVAQQALGGEEDGGVLFEHLATPGGKATMLKVKADGTVGDEETSAYEAVLVAVDSPYGAQTLFDNLQMLQKRSGTDELRAFTVHDLRMAAQIQATKEADKVSHAYLKRDVADQKAGLKRFLADAAKQTGTTFAIIDKSQALSGTNDFAKNVQRAVAIGVWEPHELKQFHERLGRACKLEKGDLVAKVFECVHIASPFAATLTAKSNAREAAQKDELPEEVKAALKELEDDDMYNAAESTAMKLAATELPNDPALTYLKCLANNDEKETFKMNNYMPLIEPLIEAHADSGEVVGD